jgi:hypothetical protein
MITSSTALQSVLEEVIARLKEFAADPGFSQKMGRVFGTQAPSAEHLLALVAKPPAIQVVPAAVLQGALGAYSLQTGEILLSQSLVEGEAGALRSVLLEELGHALDAAVNGQDTRGDEGEGFAAIVEGRELRPSEWSRIQGEDDHTTVVVNGEMVKVEAAGPTLLRVTTTLDQNNGVTTDGLSLREAILIANANPSTTYEIQLTGGATYFLTANGSKEDIGRTGDLDIQARANIVTIRSVGTGKAIINASRLLNSDRVLHVIAGGRLILQNVVVTGGAAPDSEDGGGLLVAGQGSLALINTTVIANRADSDGFTSGGGLSNRGFAYVENSTITNNNATTGGGIENSANLTIVNSSISNNESKRGAGIYNFENLTIINSTINNNRADSGGGIKNNNGNIGLFNSTISGNTVQRLGGGGIDNSGGSSSSLNIRNSTITKNTSLGSQGGGGILGGANLRNTIVAGNISNWSEFPDEVTGDDIQGTVVGNNFNLIGDLTLASGTVGTGTDLVNPNVLLGPLQNNGGFTLTHALLPGSPAINAGSTALVVADTEDLDGDGDPTEPTPVDQRGGDFVRVSGTSVDIGAFEFQPLNPITKPTITLAAFAPSVLEDGGGPLFFTFIRTGPTSQALQVNYTVAGTATLGGDYTGIAATPATKTVTFAAGAPTATVTVRPTADTIAEANETISLTLKAAPGYRIGTPTAVSGTLLNDDITSTTSTTLGSTGSSLLLLGNKPINGTGNGRNNTLTGNSAANRLKGLGGADVLTGGGNKDRDVFAYTALNDSLLRAGDGFDRITDFNRNDRLSVPRTMRPQQLSSSRGTAASLTAPAIAAVLTPANFAANSVAAFQVSGRVGTFIAMNDGRPGFQAQSDGLLFLRNYAISGTNSVAFVA